MEGDYAVSSSGLPPVTRIHSSCFRLHRFIFSTWSNSSHPISGLSPSYHIITWISHGFKNFPCKKFFARL